MKKHLKYTLIALSLIAINTSCGKSNDDICDPNQICYSSKPTELYRKLELSTNPGSGPLEVSLYKGFFDDGQLFDTFFTTESIEYYLMPTGERYTATAKYDQENDIIMVIDSDKLTSDSYQNC